MISGITRRWLRGNLLITVLLVLLAETKSLAPTQEELDDANSTYAYTYGENRAHLNALQSCVLDWLEENSTVA